MEQEIFELSYLHASFRSHYMPDFNGRRQCVVLKDEERINDVLESLGNVNMSLAALRESKVGASVSKLKKHANQGVSNRAKALVKKWKKVAEAEGLAAAKKAEKSEAGKGDSEDSCVRLAYGFGFFLWNPQSVYGFGVY